MLTVLELVEILAQVNPRLGVTEADVERTFAQIGLDSLDRFALFAEIQDRTGREIPDEDIASLQTLTSLHRYLAEGREPGA